MIYSVHIINKAGGLGYQRDFNDGLQRLSSNDYLVLAGTFHGIHAIASKISPVSGSSGVEMLETETFKHQGAEQQLRRLFELYADYVMKNPFHTPEMPIRCDRFDMMIGKMVAASI